jgi:hypothetical protein
MSTEIHDQDATTDESTACCGPAVRESCCAPSDKPSCCGPAERAPASCGCQR